MTMTIKDSPLPDRSHAYWTINKEGEGFTVRLYANGLRRVYGGFYDLNAARKFLQGMITPAPMYEPGRQS